jgi:hypothetical protein
MLVLLQINFTLKFIRKNTKLLFVLVVPVYFFIVQSSLLNKHTHFYPNGMVVTHAHPLNSDTSNHADGHEHTKNEICFYSSIHLDFYDMSPEVKISSNINFNCKKLEIYNERCSQITLVFYKKLRGPPLFQIS